MSRYAALSALALLGACAEQAADPAAPVEAPEAQAVTLDAVAEDYVKVSLALEAHDPGFVDAYYGPEEWRTAAEAEAAGLDAVSDRIDALLERAAQAEPDAEDELSDDRKAFLIAHMEAMQTRVRMARGETVPFDEETQSLYGVVAPEPDMEEVEAALAAIGDLLPGEDPLWRRVDDFKKRLEIPDENLQAVMDAAIEECRARTMDHVALPEDEFFHMELVTDQPWSGYNWYQGGHESLIEINTDLPVRIDRAVDLGCHEGYPGHHTLNSLREARMVEDRGWIEFTMFPLYAPTALIAEGTANYGIDMAFTPNEREAFERDVLYPLAGIDPALAETNAALREDMQALRLMRADTARDYLDGDIDAETYKDRIQRYTLTSPERAAQSLDFTETYRGYVVNYGVGEVMAGQYVDRVGGDDETARWDAFIHAIATPVLPSDLQE